jgi:hypothetical protein
LGEAKKTTPVKIFLDLPGNIEICAEGVIETSLQQVECFTTNRQCEEILTGENSI